MDRQFDVVIIGAGPAGLTAAIYATRANLSAAVVEEGAPGGKLVKTYEIENYPGIKKIAGVDLAIELMEHGLSFGAQLESGTVTAVEDDGENKIVRLADGRSLKARAVIVATGTKERELDLPEAQRFTGRGISYCAVCDGAFYRNQDVVVIGGGNSALEESLYLTSLVNKVYIVIRRDQFRAEASVVDKVLANDKIEIIYKHLPESLIIEDDKITGIMLKSVEDGSLRKVACSGIFPYIGADASTSFLDKSLLDERGYLLVNSDMSTSHPGIYGAGDVCQKDLRQVVTATNDGAIAANSVIKYLQKH
ncbi:MAG: thioredoxin-disulfide reductase [Erysipelotrichaceae bacterium]|nr:thioredoxin-disulfide reductase [Erysipelotrichaceae bacterium]